jgi:hypothetical protein
LRPNLPSTIFILGHAVETLRILVLFAMAVKSESSYLHSQHIEHLHYCDRELPVPDSDQLSNFHNNIREVAAPVRKTVASQLVGII